MQLRLAGNDLAYSADFAGAISKYQQVRQERGHQGQSKLVGAFSHQAGRQTAVLTDVACTYKQHKHRGSGLYTLD